MAKINFLHPTFEIAVQGGIVSTEEQKFNFTSQSYMLALSRNKKGAVIDTYKLDAIRDFDSQVLQRHEGKDFSYNGTTVTPQEVQASYYAIADDYNTYVAKKYKLPEIPIPTDAKFEKITPDDNKKGYFALSGKIADAEKFWDEPSKDAILLGLA